MRSAIRAAVIESQMPSSRGADNSLVASLRTRDLRTRESRHFQAVRKGGGMNPIFTRMDWRPHSLGSFLSAGFNRDWAQDTILSNYGKNCSLMRCGKIGAQNRIMYEAA